MLFKTSDKIKEYAQLSGTVDLTAIKATLNFVEETHIQNILGKELYDILQAAYTAAANEAAFTDVILSALLEKCRKVIGPMLCYYYAPKADVQVSDSGVQRVETQTNKTAYQYQNTNFAQANLREGETRTEQLIEFLEEKQTDYPTWVTSSSFTNYRSLFIKSGKEFDTLYPSHTPYRNYVAIRGKMYDVEENNIRELLGDTLFEDLKTKDAAATVLSAKEAQLMTRIKKTIAYYAVAFAIPMLNIRIDSNGLSVMAIASFSGNEKENTRGGADDKARAELIRSCIDSAQTWTNNMINFLKNNETDFATWKGFDAVTAAADTINVNDDLTGSYGLI